MNVTNPLPSMVPATPLTNRTGAPASTAEARPPGSSPASRQRSNSDSESASAAEPKNAASGSSDNAQGLNPAELKQLSELKARDREVRAHEAAHQAVGGQYAGAISYVYQRGPDGAQYAVGGEVSIDTSAVDGDPQATIEKMRTVRAAALAPAEPSSQDRAVAAQAMQLMLQAQAELAVQPSDQEDQAPASDEDGRGSRLNQDASQTYQSVFGLGAEASGQPANTPFKATA